MLIAITVLGHGDRGFKKKKFIEVQLIYNVALIPGIQQSESVIHESEGRPVTSNFLQPHGLYSPWNSPGQNTGVGSLSLLQGIFPTQGSNPGIPQCRQILYQLSHKESPRILGWVAYPFSSGSGADPATQESNWGLLHYRWILQQLSYQGSPSTR